MGFSVRGRTSGSKSWLNYSASKRNGVGISGSTKFGKNITLNLGKRGVRATVNFGNGIRYTATKSLKSKSSPKNANVIRNEYCRDSENTYSDYPEKGEIFLITMLIVGMPTIVISLSIFGIGFLYSLLTAIIVYYAMVTFIDRDFAWYAVPFAVLVSPAGWFWLFVLFMVCQFLK